MSAAAVTLRIATPDDAGVVSEVLVASYSALYRGWYRDDILVAALPTMTRARPELLASGRYFIADRLGAAVSCGGWSVADPRGGGLPTRGHIRHFGTHPDHLGQGCAGLIMARCLYEARASGCTDMECLSSLAAEAFYAGRGFTTIAPASVTVGGVPFACMLMWRLL